MAFKIPKEIQDIAVVLEADGHEGYLVGGCVRDLLLDESPHDWDIATDARPEDIQRLFPESFYENKFGTVTVVTKSKQASLQHIEVTPYRTEAGYSDRRHPDAVEFARTLDDDLRRRDFTVNAMAIKITARGGAQSSPAKIIDLFGGEDDLKKKIIRSVGDPKARFTEDALRLMRAVRLATTLGFEIEQRTASTIKEEAALIRFVAPERIRDELSKLMMADEPERGFEFMREFDLLSHIMPELLEGYEVGQNKHHIYTVWEHNIRALRCAADKKWSLEVRMGALLHDVGKPQSKRGDGADSTFYGHEIIGSKMATRILDRLKYPRQFVEKVSKLIYYHLFYYNVGEVTESSVRRLIRNVGPEDMEDLIRVRVCDRIGSGVPKAEPYKLRHFRFLVEKLSRDPISVGMLRVRGDDVMRIAKISPGPKIGFLLNILLEEVLDDPMLNKKSHLEGRLEELGAMSDTELKALADEAKKKAVAVEEAKVGEIKKRHWVK